MAIRRYFIVFVVMALVALAIAARILFSPATENMGRHKDQIQRHVLEMTAEASLSADDET